MAAYYIAMGHVSGGLLKDRILPRARVCRKPSLRNSSPRDQRNQYSATAMTVTTTKE